MIKKKHHKKRKQNYSGAKPDNNNLHRNQQNFLKRNLNFQAEASKTKYTDY